MRSQAQARTAPIGPLNVLDYDLPVGFARFEVCAMNPTRDKYELDAEELVGHVR